MGCPFTLFAGGARAGAVGQARRYIAVLLGVTLAGMASIAGVVLGLTWLRARATGDLQAGQEIAATSVIALKSAWQGKGGSN